MDNGIAINISKNVAKRTFPIGFPFLVSYGSRSKSSIAFHLRRQTSNESDTLHEEIVYQAFDDSRFDA